MLDDLWGLSAMHSLKSSLQLEMIAFQVSSALLQWRQHLEHSLGLLTVTLRKKQGPLCTMIELQKTVLEKALWSFGEDYYVFISH